MNNYTKKVLLNQYFGTISEHLPRALPRSFIHDAFIQVWPPLPFEPTDFFQHTPPSSVLTTVPPPHLQPFLSSCDSWFPCFDTTGHPPVIQHRLSLSTPGQNTPLRESLRQNSSRDFLVFTLLHIKLPAARNLRKLIKVIRYHFSKFTYLWISFRGVWWGVPWYSEGARQERGSSSYQDAEAGLHRETEAGLSKRGLHHGPVFPPEHHSAGGGGDQM